ncbi:MAG: tetratricopeptide repeat protein [Pseudomonadota bacterium]
MSLLYKALHQATQLREKGAKKADAADASRAGAAATAPLAERLMAEGFASTGKQGGVMRIARLTLFGLVGLAAIAVSIALLMPASPPQQVATPETVPAPQPPVADVQAAAEPVPVDPAPQEQATSEPSIADAADNLAQALDEEAADPAQTEAAAPERIGATPDPAEVRPGQKRVRDGGLEKFVEEQVAREALSGLGAPIRLDRTAAGENIGQRGPVEITDDTAIVRERYESAALMLERNQPEEALHIYDLLLRNNPRDRLALLGRAAALQKLGRSLLAISAYEDVLAAFPGDEWAMVNLLGLVSAQAPEHALAQLERLQRLNPKTALLPAQIGMVLMTQGNFEMAARSLDRAVALDPENAKYIFNLAVLYDKWGQPQNALRYYRKCLEMAAQNPDGQIPLETVRSRMTYLDVK